MFWLGIDTGIPVAFNHLAKAFPDSDASEAVVKIRNTVTHPTKSNRAQRAQLTTTAVAEAWELNLWYIELTLLKLLDYDGPYEPRIGKPPGNIFVLVPWAAN